MPRFLVQAAGKHTCSPLRFLGALQPNMPHRVFFEALLVNGLSFCGAFLSWLALLGCDRIIIPLDPSRFHIEWKKLSQDRPNTHWTPEGYVMALFRSLILSQISGFPLFAFCGS